MQSSIMQDYTMAAYQQTHMISLLSYLPIIVIIALIIAEILIYRRMRYETLIIRFIAACIPILLVAIIVLIIIVLVTQF